MSVQQQKRTEKDVDLRFMATSHKMDDGAA
jgi:hypothetical protein